MKKEGKNSLKVRKIKKRQKKQQETAGKYLSTFFIYLRTF